MWRLGAIDAELSRDDQRPALKVLGRSPRRDPASPAPSPAPSVLFHWRSTSMLSGGAVAGADAIRAVDGVTLQEYPQVFTSSDEYGAIERSWGPLNTLLLKRNAVKEALIHFSATDSRRDPNSTPANEPLWSEPPVKITL